MEITKRQKEILNRIVEEYIELAQPISSQLLERKYDFGICSATIRIEMQKLTDKGFLYQSHSSAGRIPTDRGYRFFVDGLLKKGLSELEEDFEIGDWFKEKIDNTIKFIQLLTKNLALASSALALSYFEREKIFWKEGWEEILKEPEFREEDYIINFTKLLENFEKNIEDLKLNSGIKIYIGKENPFKNTRDFSIIASKCYLPSAEDYNSRIKAKPRTRPKLGSGVSRTKLRFSSGFGTRLTLHRNKVSAVGTPNTSEKPAKGRRTMGGSESCLPSGKRDSAIISLLGPKRMDYNKNISLINSLTELMEKM